MSKVIEKQLDIALVSSCDRSDIYDSISMESASILSLETLPSVANDWVNVPDVIIIDDEYLGDWEKQWRLLKVVESFKHIPFVVVTPKELKQQAQLSYLEEGIFAIVSKQNLHKLQLICVAAIKQSKLLKDKILKTNELNRILSTNYLVIDAKTNQLETAKEKLEKLVEQEQIRRNDLKYLIGDIDKNLKEEYNYQLFKVHFEKVHPMFYKQIRVVNSKLTESNLRLLAFLKMGFSNTEISFLLNVSLAAVKKAIQRLKPKLNIDKSASIREFLFGL